MLLFLATVVRRASAFLRAGRVRACVGPKVVKLDRLVVRSDEHERMCLCWVSLPVDNLSENLQNILDMMHVAGGARNIHEAVVHVICIFGVRPEPRGQIGNSLKQGQMHHVRNGTMDVT
jgi:hypothetical protein